MQLFHLFAKGIISSCTQWLFISCQVYRAVPNWTFFLLKMSNFCARFILNSVGFIVTNCTISSGCCFLEMVPEVKNDQSHNVMQNAQCSRMRFSLSHLFLVFLPLPVLSMQEQVRQMEDDVTDIQYQLVASSR